MDDFANEMFIKNTHIHLAAGINNAIGDGLKRPRHSSQSQEDGSQESVGLFPKRARSLPLAAQRNLLESDDEEEMVREDGNTKFYFSSGASIDFGESAG